MKMIKIISILPFFYSVYTSALTLSPMYSDNMVYSDFEEAIFKVSNESDATAFYDIWVTNGESRHRKIYESEMVVAQNNYSMFTVPIRIKPDQLEVFFVCVQERPSKASMQSGVIARICAKLRFYWPRSLLRKQ